MSPFSWECRTEDEGIDYLLAYSLQLQAAYEVYQSALDAFQNKQADDLSKPSKVCLRTLKRIVAICFNTIRPFHEALFRPIPTALSRVRTISVSSSRVLPLALGVLPTSENGFYSNKYLLKTTKKAVLGQLFTHGCNSFFSDYHRRVDRALYYCLTTGTINWPEYVPSPLSLRQVALGPPT